MMRVTVNGRCVADVNEDGGTLAGLLGGLRARGEIAGDEVVVGLEVNSSPCAARDLDALADVALGESSEVAIATDDLPGYGRRILADARSMRCVLEEAAERLPAEFRSRELRKANAGLFNLLNALESFILCLSHVRNTCAASCGPSESWQRIMAQVSESLDAIQDSQQAKDWMSLAGHLELKLLPALRGFEPVVKDMSDAIS